MIATRQRSFATNSYFPLIYEPNLGYSLPAASPMATIAAEVKSTAEPWRSNLGCISEAEGPR